MYKNEATVLHPLLRLSLLYRDRRIARTLCANISETPAPISLESKRAVRRITDGGDTRDDEARESILGGGSP